MRILLDENLPVKLRLEWKGHEIFSVRELGWNGKKNGELLEAMVQNKIDLLVTLDKNLVHQNKIKSLPLSVAILNAKNSKILTLIPYLKRTQEVTESSFSRGEIWIIDL